MRCSRTGAALVERPIAGAPLLLVILLLLCCYCCKSMAQQDASTQPRAWTVPSGVRFGDLERLALQPFQDTATVNSPTTIQVATRAVGLNFADVFTLLGYYPAANLVRTKTNQAFVPGLEFAGVALEDGGGFCKGDRVYGFTRFGAYSDLVQVPPTQLRKLPSNWTFEQGAAFLVNALTAWYGLVTVAGMTDCNRTEYNNDNPFVVVVHSAAGGVGLWACEIAARLGALVVGVIGDQSKTTTFYDRIRPLCPFAQCLVRRSNAREFAKGLASAICRARSLATGLVAPDWTEANDLVQAGWGANVLMESYGGQYFQPCMDLMNAGGSIATYGSTTYNGSGSGTRLPFVSLVLKYLQRPMVDPGELTGRNLRIGGFNLIFLTENTQELSKALEDCIACLSGTDDRSACALESVTPPVVGNVYDFENGAIDALTALRSGKTVGKVVLSNKSNPLLTHNLHGDTRMES